MSYASCPAHSDFAREGCSDCIERRTRPPARPWLTGIEKTRLESVRARLSDDDGAAYDMAVDLDEDGEVHFRPATMADQLDRIVVKWIWEHQHRWLGGEVD